MITNFDLVFKSDTDFNLLLNHVQEVLQSKIDSQIILDSKICEALLKQYSELNSPILLSTTISDYILKTYSSLKSPIEIKTVLSECLLQYSDFNSPIILSTEFQKAKLVRARLLCEWTGTWGDWFGKSFHDLYYKEIN